MQKRIGRGLINKLIDKLPVELHLPGYSFCGPGTNLSKRANQTGINKLDQACRLHDISYANPTSDRSIADIKLENAAWNRVKSRDAKLSEKAAAWVVTNMMKVKRKIGAGSRKNKKKAKLIGLRKVINAARKGMKQTSSDNIGLLTKNALIAARKEVKGKMVRPHARVIKVPTHTGGFLASAIPVLAALSSLGSIVGGLSSISKAVADFRAASNSKKPIPISGGKGLYVKPYKKGFGIISKN